MQGTDVYSVLEGIGATFLYHANSVTTSSTFLEEGGLVSRGFVEGRGLKQTPQSSDPIDKKYDIWHRIFLDHVDIHGRAGRRKGPNQYGPVLFVLDLDVLLGLPTDTEVCVTKENPIHWHGKPDNERWFQSAEELAADICYGDFGKIVVIQTPSGKLDFPNAGARIILDDPQRRVSSGEDAYTSAENRLKETAAAGRGAASIERRECYNDCMCVKKYASYPTQRIDRYFA